MGNGMNKVLPGLYVGNFRDAKDTQQLTDNKITHILSIHDNAKQLHEDKEYLCITASDNSAQDLTQFFPECIEFIHVARLKEGHVLVHCLAGVSRSVTVTAAYIMTVTNLGWKDALNCIRGVRNGANPNFAFQKQLQNFEHEGLQEARKNLRQKYPETVYDDAKECQANLCAFRKFVLHGSPSKDDDLYPLPYNAYKGKGDNSTQVANTQSNSQCKDSTQNDNHDESNSGGKISSGNSDDFDNGSELSQNNEDSAKGKENNRSKTVDFEKLSDDIDESYANFYAKKVQ